MSTSFFPQQGLLLLLLWLASLTLNSVSAQQRVYPGLPVRPLVRLTNDSTRLRVAALKPGDLRFTVQTLESAWSPRFKTSVELYSKQVRFTDSASQRPVTFPANSFLLHGGEGGENDVWLSSDKGRRWSLISGRYQSESAAAPYDELSFVNQYAASSFMLASSGSVLRVGGVNTWRDLQAEVSSSWSSSDGLRWTDLSLSARTTTTTYFSSSVANSQGHLIALGGVEELGNTVAVSVDAGKNWRVNAGGLPFGPRHAAAAVNWQTADGTDVIIHVAGEGNVGSLLENFNDVWASSDEGRTWAAINPAATFPQRSYHSLSITKDGLLVLVAGLADQRPGYFGTPYNDVWVSADGGYSWGECVEDAEWDDRLVQSSLLDEGGVLFVIAGLTTDYSVYLNDVWKSTISFHDLQAVSSACKVEIPACGPGLKCWPGAGTVRASDGSFVSCAACVHPSLSGSQSASSSAGMAVIIALVAFVLLAALLLLLCVWIVYAVVRAGHPSPLPLPAALQRRWAPKSQNLNQLLSTEQYS